MITKIEYGNFLSNKSNVVTITNDIKQKWELKRIGISENEVKTFVKILGKTEGIKCLIDKGNLIPVYGGDLNL